MIHTRQNVSFIFFLCFQTVIVSYTMGKLINYTKLKQFSQTARLSGMLIYGGYFACWVESFSFLKLYKEKTVNTKP